MTLARDTRYSPYSKETAMCVDLALDGVEEDIQREIAAAGGNDGQALRRVLEKTRERRKMLEQFTRAA
jgi:hypothetical protein